MGNAAGRRRDPSRRAVLGGGGLLLVAACTGGSDGPPAAPRPTRDQRLAVRVAAEVRDLSARYAATIAAHPRDAALLSRLAAEHDAHVTALVALGPPTPSPSSSPSASSTPSSSATTAGPPPVPAARVAALTALVSAEQAAATRRRTQTAKAGPELARLLASIAACESVHAQLVRP
jgi:pimeloyl-ACP methyl ester carboxylesterase